MKRIKQVLQTAALLLLAACAGDAVTPLAPDDPSLAGGGNGHHLRDLDANANIGADTTVLVGDVIRVGLAAGNGNGPQNNKNVVWTTSNATVVAVVPDRGRATLTALAPGTATVCAKLGGNSVCVTITVVADNTPPTAVPDAYEAIGNVTLSIAAPGVLANDTDAEGGLTVVSGTFPTTGGGMVTLSPDGSFVYRGAAGYTGVDQFDYTATDGSASSTATVTITLPYRVWYVKNDATAPGDGRDASPFTTLAQAEAASSAGERIFVFYGDGTSSGMDQGITLKAGQALIGQGVSSDVTTTLNGETVVLLAAGSAPTITRASAGATVQLAAGDTVRGLAIESTAGAGIAGTGFVTFVANESSVEAVGGPALDLDNGAVLASFTVLSSLNSSSEGISLTNIAGTLDGDGGALVNAAGPTLHVDGGNANVTYGGDITNVAGRSALVVNRAGGTLSHTGDIDDTGDGILVDGNGAGTIEFIGTSKLLNTGSAPAVTVTNNGGATVRFAGGGLDIATAGANGFTASNGGTVIVTGVGNEITTTNATALSATNVTIGTGGLAFRRIDSSGGPNGIYLQNTGNVSGLLVSGTGTIGSGGSIVNSVGADGTTDGIGVYLDNVRSIALAGVIVDNHPNFGIRGNTVNGFTLEDSRLAGTHGTSAAFDEAVISFTGLRGVAMFRADTISGGVEDNVRIVNTGVVAPADSIVFDNVRMGHNSLATGNNNLSVRIADGSDNRVSVRNSLFHGARNSQLQLDVVNSATAYVVLDDNQFHNTHPATLSGAGGVLLTANGTVASVPTLTYAIADNSFRGARGVALNVNKDVGQAVINGVVNANSIGQSGVVDSGSSGGSGIQLRHQGGGTHRATVSNNQVLQYNNFGILLEMGDALLAGGNGRMDATVMGNSIAEPGSTAFIMNGFHANIGTVAGDAHLLCLALNANSMDSSAKGGLLQDVRLRQRMSTTIQLPGYLGANNDNAAVNAFVNANNGGSPALVVAASNTVPTGGGYTNGACIAPTL